jgi:hypothetical protein
LRFTYRLQESAKRSAQNNPQKFIFTFPLGVTVTHVHEPVPDVFPSFHHLPFEMMLPEFML